MDMPGSTMQTCAHRMLWNIDADPAVHPSSQANSAKSSSKRCISEPKDHFSVEGSISTSGARLNDRPSHPDAYAFPLEVGNAEDRNPSHRLRRAIRSASRGLSHPGGGGKYHLHRRVEDALGPRTVHFVPSNLAAQQIVAWVDGNIDCVQGCPGRVNPSGASG